MPPCGDDDQPGCGEFLDTLELDVVEEEVGVPKLPISRRIDFREERQVSITGAAPCYNCGGRQAVYAFGVFECYHCFPRDPFGPALNLREDQAESRGYLHE